MANLCFCELISESRAPLNCWKCAAWAGSTSPSSKSGLLERFRAYAFPGTPPPVKMRFDDWVVAGGSKTSWIEGSVEHMSAEEAASSEVPWVRAAAVASAARASEGGGEGEGGEDEGEASDETDDEPEPEAAAAGGGGWLASAASRFW